MDRKDFVKKLYAGIFFVIGILLILAVVFVIGMEKGLTQPKFQVRVVFKDVGGLSVGAPVRLSGVNIGTVGKIDFLEEKVDGRGVDVTLNLFKRYRRQVEKGTRFTIKTERILGQKLIAISTENGDSFNLAETVLGEDPLDVQDLAESFDATAVSLQEASDNINKMLKQLEHASKTFKRLVDRIEQRIIDGDLFKVF